MESQSFKRALAHPTCRRDVPLLGMVDGTLLELVADLVYETADGMTLVGFLVDHGEGEGEGASGGTPLPRRAVAGLLALAFTSATRLAVRAVEVIAGADGSVTRFTGAADLAEEARALLRDQQGR